MTERSLQLCEGGSAGDARHVFIVGGSRATRGRDGSSGTDRPTADPPLWDGPAIGLLDLDAFFASVEQLDHPEWRGKPVIVGGDADKRGVVSTASYEARAYGVHSAMPSAQARRLCPDAIWTHGDFARYREMSARVMGVILDETPYVEQVSIDEAFFDVTPGRFSREDPVAITRRIAGRVEQLGVTCSIGLAVNKTAAKIASERNKPRGITVVYPGSERDFLAPLPVGAMSGVGEKTRLRLEAMGIRTLGDLAAADPHALEESLGIVGPRLIVRAAGREVSRVLERDADPDAKSVSNERTFERDLTTAEEVDAAIGFLSAMVARRLRRKGLAGRVVTLRITYAYGDSHTASVTLGERVDNERDIAAAARSVRDGLWGPGTHVRLMGVAVSGFEPGPSRQLSLFEDARAEEESRERASRLAKASDRLRERFGDNALMYGSELRFRSRVSNTAPLHKDEG